MVISRSRQTDFVLERLIDLHPRRIDLGLERTSTLLSAMGSPEKYLPPTIHVAGTNGKGSSIAYMRAIAEAAGLVVHSYTSPHLIHFHERINLQGRSIEDDKLLSILKECEAANAGSPITLFEITTVAAFVAFSRSPADLLLLETGLGGRLDATNVIKKPFVTAITPVSIDHTEFLGAGIEKIAFEKAGIIKPRVPCIVSPQPPEVVKVIKDRADQVSAPLFSYGTDWFLDNKRAGHIVYRDLKGTMKLPRPVLHGKHQVYNAGLAIAGLRVFGRELFQLEDFSSGLLKVFWPGRLQLLAHGELRKLLPIGVDLWVDGGHNPAAAESLAETVADWNEPNLVLICALQKNKDIAGFLSPLLRVCSTIVAINLPGNVRGHSPEKILGTASNLGANCVIATSLPEALGMAVSSSAKTVLICGSLYLAGEALSLNGRLARASSQT